MHRDKKYLENAKNPRGEFGRDVLKRMNVRHAGLTQWALSLIHI